MESLTITLAGTAYKIQELTIGQLEDIHAELGQDWLGDPRDLWKRYRRVIVIAVDNPAVTEESLKTMRLGTVKTVKDIFESIVTFGGFGKKANAPAGEAPAGAA